MKVLIASVLLASACGGPSVNAVAETPTATTKRTPVVAPSGGVDDDERYWVTTTLNDAQDAQQAQREARAYPPETPPRQALAPVPPGAQQPSPTPVAPDRADDERGELPR